MIIAKHQVEILETPQRLSDYLIGKFAEIQTRKGIKKAIEKRQVLVNDELATTAYWVQSHDVISLQESQSLPPKQFELDLEIPYEDDYLAVVIKPAGIPVSGNLYKTLFNALGHNLKHSSQVDALRWPLPVHRLDTATSGLVIVAKTHSVRVALGKMFENRKVSKRYRAILQGTIEGEGIIDTEIDGKESLTHYQVVENIETLKDTSLTLIDLFPITGRKHQLRIHTSLMGLPIVGDQLYQGDIPMKTDKGLFLVALELNFVHPATNEKVKVEIAMPDKFSSYLAREKKRFDKYRILN
jgi:23S rRNA pseudouridine1911/1915/1917 synthase